jgi:hemolysin III
MIILKITKIIVRKNFSLGEEIANAVTHGLGILLSITVLVLFVIKGQDNHNMLYKLSMMVYSISMLALFASSTLYHAFKEGRVKNVFERFDHLSIYVLIAGTYTPFCLIAIGGIKGIVICIIQWTLAIVGVVFKAIWIDRYIKIHVIIYLIMGWMIILFVNSIFKSIPLIGFYFLLLGGISYSIGVLFYVFNWFKYHHLIWHIFVLGGSISIFLFIYIFI